MFSFRLITTFIVVMALVIIATGCKKTTTEETFEPKLLLSNLSVSVVKQGTEIITIIARDEHDSTQTFSVECEDEDIASVTKTDSTITVTGKNLGTTNVTVSCGNNLTRTFPVEVYNPKVLGADELIIQYVDQFEYRWCSLGPGDTWGTSFYHPVTTDGFHALGSFSFRELSNPTGKKAVVVVKAKDGSDALKPPVDYDSVWSNQGSGIGDFGSLWNPVPPTGYKALGTVAQQGFDKPSLDEVVCVREDLAINGDCGEGLFGGNNGRAKCMVYLIEPPDAGAKDSCFLSTGTFVGTEIFPRIPSFPVMNVLKIKLPMKKEGPNQDFAPKLTGYDTPPEVTVPLMGKEMFVPWSLLKDEQLSEIERYKDSPLYRLERQVFYKLLYHNYNQTSVQQENKFTIRSGITTSESQRIYNNTRIEINVQAGLRFRYFAVSGYLKTSVTVTKDFGYEKQTDVTELRETEVENTIFTPPGKAAALWQKYNRFILKRHNGTTFEPVESWEFGIDSYITDEFPHE
ncbi:MAG: Vps62-related protein [candidate division WOR-3 bacterium]|nr:Vps62-related protein [candidate division WOR-3 bacterium]